MIISDGRRRNGTPTATPMSVTFDVEHHLYAIDGVRVPSVSAILRSAGLVGDYSQIPSDILERARARGVAVHSACEAIDRGAEPDGVSAEVSGYVAGYRRFLRETQFDALATEEIVAHREYRYAGRFDAFGWLGGLRTMIDRKAVARIDHVATSVQLAAYSCARDYMHPESPVEQIAALHLRPDGGYVLHLEDQSHALDVWHAALQIYGYKKLHGGDK